MTKILSVLLVSSLILSIGYVYFEPEIIAAAVSTPTPIVVTLTVTSEITLTSPGNITMSTPITMSVLKAVGTGSAWNVKTNNQAGYKLELKGDQAAILHNVSSSWADYTESTANIPETWSVATTAYEFGFSVFGTDTPTATWGTDTDCIAGDANTPSAALKYRGFTSTNAIQVATRATTTVTAGVNTTLCLGAEQGSAIYAPSGTYTANVTGTATTL